MAADPSAPALTIYNQKFAVVRDHVPLDLKAGENQVRFSETTAHLEPDSVILRDPRGKIQLQVLEQNYRNDPVSQELLLSFFEGKTIDFLVTEPNKPNTVVKGKVVRSGYVPHDFQAQQRYGQNYMMAQRSSAFGASVSQPIIEVDGLLRFSLPGQPLFPPLADDAVLKPALEWRLQASQPAKLMAEIAYVTDGMSWEADYNLVAPEQSDLLEIVGWVTIDNQSGKTFENAQIKLMAGDVSKVQRGDAGSLGNEEMAVRAAASTLPPVSEKAFEDYHLYTLQRATTLRDRETKQVEFVRARGVKSERIYVYDGLKIEASRWRGYTMENIRNNSDFGNEMTTKVAVMREFRNSEANHLGMPLPKGRVRFYKQDADHQLEFTGENLIDHTPRDETLRVYTGNAFDLVGARDRKNFKSDSANHWFDETFEITLRNHKKEAAEIRVVKHLFRWTDWEITARTDSFTKTDAQAIEFRLPLQPDEEMKLSYTVHYSW